MVRTSGEERRNRIMDLIKAVEQSQLRSDLPNVEVGDYVRVALRITEGSRERIQVFEGTVIARKGQGLSETILVRRVTYGIGVERTLPVHSPSIDNIEVVRKGVVRRAKLYYLRDRVGKSARLREKLSVKHGDRVVIAEPVEEVDETTTVESSETTEE